MNLLDKQKVNLYVAFRVILGFLFLSHGLQKLFGWFGGNIPDLLSLIWFAGLIELVAGTFVLVGLFTRLSATISALEMIVAYFMVHAGKAAVPIVNGGELALLYLAAFLIVMGHGAQKWSLTQVLFKKEFL